ncbi:hypothetical protein [Psychrobacter sp. Cmf 22.2]|uniref:hypothetical protein n=1 Tax=Psychrobacter sp. Cmf 22.2 TaxID=1926478 RepID=UPI000947128F|nr:hypothetical protein [Psychrobacter sp. Cmf 22.2]OLF36708.1 hypothetical protein BTV98_09840 [Psychrobacter sp. Cmf 22.2]
MPYLFGGLVLLNALMLGYYLFIQKPTPTESLQTAQAELTHPITFINSAKHVPPLIGTKE